ncbi:helix-turn-helix domain-containing protein [Clostridium perfringens]|uniref:helix-turn-helix domain-containing protein n=1 Tax=Clostridium perfringens TaxID=1502 RepID=UPI000DD09846
MVKILKEYRRINNISQKELAKKLKISRSHLSELEHKASAPSYDLLVRISNTLKICPLKLLKYYSSENINFNCCKYGCYLTNNKKNKE